MVSKQICFVAFLCLFYFVGIAQLDNANRRDSIRILNARYHNFDLLLDKRVQRKNVPVSRIEFADMRYDTTFIALNWRGPFFGSLTHKDKFNLSGGVAAHLTRYYQYQYVQDTTASDHSLVCFIKDFSITAKQDVLDHYFQSPSLSDNSDNYIHVDIECFYRQGDSLYPALQLDTTYLAHFLVKQTKLSNVVEDMLQPFEDKLEHLTIPAILSRNHYSEAFVWSRYKQRFQIPLLTTTQYKRGIYKSIAELRNQTPSIDSFTASLDKEKIRATAFKYYDFTSLLFRTLQKRNTTVYLYDTPEKLIDPSNIFVYCPDGETLWIQHGSLYYPLVKTGNSFEFLYIYHIPDYNGHTITVDILTPLHIETGKSN